MMKQCIPVVLISVVLLSWGNTAFAGKFLRLQDRDHVELEKTQGFLNLNGTLTLETWLRWNDDHPGVISLISDDLTPGELPSATVRQKCGWILRVSAMQNGRFRDLELSFASALPRQTVPKWYVLRKRIMALPEGETSGWHHIALCKTPQVLIVYLDGKPIFNAPCAGSQFFPAPTNLYLGIRKGARATRKVYADFRAFRVVDRIVYRRPFKPQMELPKHGRTVLQLDFQQGEAGVIPDISSGNHSGTILGGEWLED